MQCLVKALAALFQFGAQIRLFGSSHITSCHRLLFCSGAFHPISSFKLRNPRGWLDGAGTGSKPPTRRWSVKEQAVSP